MARSRLASWTGGADPWATTTAGSGGHLGGTRHLPREIVRDAPCPDRTFESAHNRACDVVPTQLFEHHGSRQDDAARIDLVLPRILGRRAVRRFEHRVAVTHVAAGREA